MRVSMSVAVLCGAMVLSAASGAGAQQTPPAGRQGGGPRNIQVLPKEWTGQQVQQFMRTVVAPGLGVMCNHCHVQDRASDEKKEKVAARKMIQVMLALNETHLKEIGDPAVAQKVTCYTCHRGTLKPLTGPPSGSGN
jgi:hypothetical protein